ncbi:MAG TPA: PRC-barrel domain-containing protein [Azospirillaceae bacterium]|nr:PRC-barrel domain-containing protein [Azospirillaceae bacterium]
MRKDLIGAVSALALLSGAALAQSTAPSGSAPTGSTPSTTTGAQGSPATMGNSDGRAATGAASPHVSHGAGSEAAAGAEPHKPGQPGGNPAPRNPNAGTDKAAAAQETAQPDPANRKVGVSGTAEADSAGKGTADKDGDDGASDDKAGGDKGAEAPKADGTSTAMDRTQVEKLLGRTVVGDNGEEIGEVEDVVLDPQTGQARQLVVASGGFLGIGEKNVAVDFRHAQVTPGADQIKVTGLRTDGIRAMPEFQYDDRTVSLNRSAEGAQASGTVSKPDRPTGDTAEGPAVPNPQATAPGSAGPPAAAKP